MGHDFDMARHRVSLTPGSGRRYLAIIRYQKPYKLAGVVYLHRITDPRINGPAVKNFHVVARICGRPNMSNVVLVTTFWGQAARDTGTQREAELKDTFWKEISEKGCQVVRFHGGH
jgi:hypothetical protein